MLIPEIWTIQMIMLLLREGKYAQRMTKMGKPRLLPITQGKLVVIYLLIWLDFFWGFN